MLQRSTVRYLIAAYVADVLLTFVALVVAREARLVYGDADKVTVEGADAELRKDLAMHIAAMNPPYLRRADVDAAAVEEERARAAEEAKGKPPQIIEKIVAGKLDRWYAEVVLLDQPFVKDDKHSVGQVLANAAGESMPCS